MDPAEKKRKIIIGVALVATLIAVVLVEDEEDMVIDTAQPVASNKPTRSESRRSQIQETRNDYLDIDLLGQRKFDPQAGELFASTSWAPKRPQITPQQQAFMEQQRAARAKAPPPTPTPPPLQFKYIGKAIEGNKTWVFLSQADENFIAKIGEKIDDQYRLDTITDEVVTLTYLPLDAKQTLPINDNKQAGNFR